MQAYYVPVTNLWDNSFIMTSCLTLQTEKVSHENSRQWQPTSPQHTDTDAVIENEGGDDHHSNNIPGVLRLDHIVFSV